MNNVRILIFFMAIASASLVYSHNDNKFIDEIQRQKNDKPYVVIPLSELNKCFTDEELQSKIKLYMPSEKDICPDILACYRCCTGTEINSKEWCTSKGYKWNKGQNCDCERNDSRFDLRK